MADIGQSFTTIAHNDTYPAIDPVSKPDHSGHVVLITGASKGIGSATAISFAKAGAAAIILAARSSLDEVEQKVLVAAAEAGHRVAPRVLKIQADVTSSASAKEVARLVSEEFGKLDILINNAGYLEHWASIADVDEDDWWLSWEINVKGTFMLTKHLLPLLLVGSQKTVLNISSMGALLVSPGASGYQSAKLAVMRFTQHLDTEYGKDGLCAVCIHPGGVPTKLALGMPGNLHTMLVDTPDLGADTITWLTKENRRWLSGRYISVNWDMEQLVTKRDEIVKGNKLKLKMAF